MREQWPSLGAIGLILALLGVAIAAPRAHDPPSPSEINVCADEDTKGKIREILLHGLDIALQERITELFEVWMRDSSGQPARARAGIERGIDAYVHGRQGVMAWKGRPC
jgi:hypothetical protein